MLPPYHWDLAQSLGAGGSRQPAFTSNASSLGVIHYVDAHFRNRNAVEPGVCQGMLSASAKRARAVRETGRPNRITALSGRITLPRLY